MKIKKMPGDFIVEEILNHLPYGNKYSIFRVTKTGINTSDVIEVFQNKLKCAKNDISAGGNKDKHSISTQFISVKGNHILNLDAKNIKAEKVFTSSIPITPNLILKNNFTITIRDLTDNSILEIEERINGIKKYGFPNYYDEQRFRSCKNGNFFAEEVLKGHFKGALKIYLENTRNQQAIRIKKIWDRSNKSQNSALKLLKTINIEEIKFQVNVFQAFLFNEILSRYIKFKFKDYYEIRYSLGKFAFYRTTDETEIEKLKKIEIPVPGRKPFFPDNIFDEIYQSIKKERNIKDSFFNNKKIFFIKFKPFKRNILVFPEAIKIISKNDDEIYKGKKKITIIFSLPSGSYATILLKTIAI